MNVVETFKPFYADFWVYPDGLVWYTQVAIQNPKSNS